MPFTTISRKILCGDLLPLCPLPPLSASLSSTIPMSVSYYEVIIVLQLRMFLTCVINQQLFCYSEKSKRDSNT